jgi:two-component system, LytTR family, sensor kinase
MKNYLNLQQLRFRNPEYIKASLPKQSAGISIVPVLFIPFIENAFKYSSEKGIYPVINISLIIMNKSIIFECSNYFDENATINGQKGGVGLSNVKRRLELLYQNKYTLDITKDNSIYKVVLKINTE